MTSPIAQLIAELRDDVAELEGSAASGRKVVTDECVDRIRRAAEALADYQAVRDERDTLASNYANLLADTSGEIAGLRSALACQEELLAEAGKVVGPFAEVARPMLRTYPQEAELFAWASPLGGNLMLSDFRAAARLSDKLKGE